MYGCVVIKHLMTGPSLEKTAKKLFALRRLTHKFAAVSWSTS